MVPKKILGQYLRTWFTADWIVVVPDWIFTIVALKVEAGLMPGTP